MTSTTRTLMADSARARSLARCVICADLDARRGPQLEPRDHRTRVHRDDLGLDAEIPQLQLDQARHRLERLGRVAALARRRVVEQRERRQFRGARALEQRHLLFLLDALALLDLGRDRLDPRRLALRRLLLLLAHDFLPRLLHFAPRLDVTRGHEPALDPVDAGEHAAPMRSITSSHEMPVNERDRAEPDREQQQRRAEEAERLVEPEADERSRAVRRRCSAASRPGNAASPARSCSRAPARIRRRAARAHGGRSAPCCAARGTASKPAKPSMTGNRKAGAPNSTKNRSDNQAPTGPIRLVTGPGCPVDEKAGIGAVVAGQRHEQDQRRARRGSTARSRAGRGPRWPPAPSARASIQSLPPKIT